MNDKKVHDSTFTRYPQYHTHRNRQNGDCQGLESEQLSWGVGTGELFNRYKVLVFQDETFPGNCFATLWIYLTLLNCTLRMVQMVQFMLHAFHYNRNKFKVSPWLYNVHRWAQWSPNQQSRCLSHFLFTEAQSWTPTNFRQRGLLWLTLSVHGWPASRQTGGYGAKAWQSKAALAMEARIREKWGAGETEMSPSMPHPQGFVLPTRPYLWRASQLWCCMIQSHS